MEPTSPRWRIPPEELARHEARRGRRHAFEHLDGPSTALVVVDLVPFFVDDADDGPVVVAAVRRLADATRSAGGHVCWVVPGAEPETAARREFFGDEVWERYRASGGGGRPAARLVPGLVAPGDRVIEKTAPSALAHGRSDLRSVLAELGVETLVVVGAVMEVCVESTVRDAATLGFRTIVAPDAILAARPAGMAGSVRTIHRSFGDVRTLAEVEALLAAGAGGTG